MKELFWVIVIIWRLLLKDERVDPAACYNLAIIITSKNGHVEVIKLLKNERKLI